MIWHAFGKYRWWVIFLFSKTACFYEEVVLAGPEHLDIIKDFLIVIE